MISDPRKSEKAASPLVDSFGRVHTSLRISVTDRCNIRCFYCMPDENIRFKPREELLTFEEIARFAEIVSRFGVRKLRLTGGEPLVRHKLHRLVAQLAAIPSIEDIALTTNGILLADQARALKEAGLSRVNISLDAMREETFQKISRRPGLDRVLAGIDAAINVGFEKVRLNAVAIQGITEAEVVPLVRFAHERSLEMRFIEFMPLDAEGKWEHDKVLTGAAIRAMLETEIGPIEPIEREDPSQPAVDFRFVAASGPQAGPCRGGGIVGFINPVTRPFCSDCNRLRITAEGQLRNCLFSTVEWDARALLRGGASDAEIEQLVRDCVAAKKAGHGIDSAEFVRPQRAMYQIGG